MAQGGRGTFTCSASRKFGATITFSSGARRSASLRSPSREAAPDRVRQLLPAAAAEHARLAVLDHDLRHARALLLRAEEDDAARPHLAGDVLEQLRDRVRRAARRVAVQLVDDDEERLVARGVRAAAPLHELVQHRGDDEALQVRVVDRLDVDDARRPPASSRARAAAPSMSSRRSRPDCRSERRARAAARAPGWWSCSCCAGCRRRDPSTRGCAFISM